MLREVVMEKEEVRGAALNALGANAATVESVAAVRMAENFMVIGR